MTRLISAFVALDLHSIAPSLDFVLLLAAIQLNHSSLAMALATANKATDDTNKHLLPSASLSFRIVQPLRMFMPNIRLSKSTRDDRIKLTIIPDVRISPLISGASTPPYIAVSRLSWLRKADLLRLPEGHNLETVGIVITSGCLLELRRKVRIISMQLLQFLKRGLEQIRLCLREHEFTIDVGKCQ